MNKTFHKILTYSYYTLFFLVPLTMWTTTSELFEFNKMIVVYIFTAIISASWISKMIIKKDIIFQKTLLDVPLLIFLGAMFFSTVFSVDFRTSLLGYYSRFNGGFLSLFCYSILYWGIVSNFNKREVKSLIKISFVSGLLSSLYGIAEHFGIDKDIWIQDVQNRVFSTFGQPNWMAAWLVSVLPISLYFSLTNKPTLKSNNSSMAKSIYYFVLPQIFLITLFFTKSRSGILGFFVSMLIFWASYILFFIVKKQKLNNLLKVFIPHGLSFFIIIFLIGTPWTPKLTSLFNKTSVTAPVQLNKQKTQGPLLTVGGSQSTEIRKIVWTGALDLWKKYPIFGTGLETFAFTYYETRPLEHNLVSEWDFLYNKAHNEYLNFMSTTGTVGIISYLVLIIITIFQLLNLDIAKIKSFFSRSTGKKTKSIFNCNFTECMFMVSLASGFISILITNFFGFSVVPINLLLFTFPAVAFAFLNSTNEKVENVQSFNKLPIYLIWGMAALILFKIANYWRADYYYSYADKYNSAGVVQKAYDNIEKAIKLSPNEAIFHDEKSSIVGSIAVFLQQQGEEQQAKQVASSAMAISQKAVSLSPRNVNIQRTRARVAIKLSEINPLYIVEAENVLISALKYAPTEAKLMQNLGLVYYQKGELDKSIQTLKKTIEMKPNYHEARYALALVYSESDQNEKAIEQTNYILEKILPNDHNAKKLQESLTSSEESE